MTEIHDFRTTGRSEREPGRDGRLGALLRELLGEVPMAEVNWDALSGRIGAAIRASQSVPWWSYAERWRRRAVPLAVAAGLLGTVVLLHPWATHPVESVPLTSAGDMVSAVVAGAPAEDAATTFTRALTTVAELTTDVTE